MHIDPSGYVVLAFLITSIVISVLFEMYDDYSNDGELNPIYNWKGYLGAFTSGFFGGLSGGGVATIGWSIVGGVADYFISGESNEETFLSDIAMISIVSGISVGIGFGMKRVTAALKARSILKLGSNNLSNRALRDIGMSSIKVGQNSVKDTLGKLIYESGTYFTGKMARAVSTSVASNTVDDGLYWIFD